MLQQCGSDDHDGRLTQARLWEPGAGPSAAASASVGAAVLSVDWSKSGLGWERGATNKNAPTTKRAGVLSVTGRTGAPEQNAQTTTCANYSTRRPQHTATVHDGVPKRILPSARRYDPFVFATGVLTLTLTLTLSNFNSNSDSL